MSRRGAQLIRNRDSVVFHERLVAGKDRVRSDPSVHSSAGGVVETVRLDEWGRRVAGVFDDCLAERVFGAEFCGGSGFDHGGFMVPVGRYDGVDQGCPKGEGSGLVQDDGVDLAQGFEVDAAFDDHPEPGSTADPAEDGEGGAGGDTTGSGHYDH
jgi:hypothetical protein